MPLGQSHFLTRVFEGHVLGDQQHGVGTFDQTNGHRGGAHPRLELLLFLLAQFYDQSGFATAHH